MKVCIVEEHGIGFALAGLGLSFGTTSSLASHGLVPTPGHVPFDRMLRRAEKLTGLGGGHDKFLRAITVHMVVCAPLFWWKQFDTYKVGTVTQSESTMHTLMETPISAEMFSDGVDPIIVDLLELHRRTGDFKTLNASLPHSFLQFRAVTTNYAALQNIIRQRQGHRLPEWRLFVDEIIRQCQYPALLWPDRLAKQGNAAAGDGGGHEQDTSHE